MRPKPYQFIIPLILIFYVFCVVKQTEGQSINFDHLNNTDGLSNNAVVCSVQDNNGFLWFGTKDGLNRFDGYRFKKYYSDNESNNGLISNYIISLFVDQDNQLWIGSDRGLYMYNPMADNFEIIHGTENDEIIEIEEDKNGDIWFISNFRLMQLIKKSNKVLPYHDSKKRTAKSITVDANKEIWAASFFEIFKVNSNVAFPLPKPDVGNIDVESLTFCANGKLWIGTQQHGLYYIEVNDEKYTHVLPFIDQGVNLFIRDMQMVHPDFLWIATETGLIVMNITDNSYEQFNYELDNPWSISDNALYTITLDHQGGVWIGSYFAGINYYHLKHNLFQKIIPRNSTNSISGRAIREIISEPSGNLWIGTEDNGLNYYDVKTNKFQHFSTKTGLSDNNIHGLTILGDSLLIGTFNNGLDVMNIHTKKIIAQFNTQNTNGDLGNNFIMSINKTKKGRILMSTPRGLYHFIPGMNQFKTVKDVPDSIFYTSVLEDDQENIWLTTWRDGVYYLNKEYKTIKVFKHNPDDSLSLNSNRTNRVYQDSNNNYWIATENGIFVWNKINGVVKRFTKRDGLSSNLIFTMAEDSKKNLWISTSYGLTCINIDDFKLSVYNQEYGLSNLQFNYNSLMKDPNGNLYFGSTNGLIKFHPDSITRYKANQPVVPIYMTNLRSSKKEFFFNDIPNDQQTNSIKYPGIQLAHDESSFQIEFAALNYVDAASTSYEYKLNGFDSEWKLTRINQVSFSRIPSGNYELLIRALDSQGKVISKELGLKITVEKPFWANGYALMVYGFLFLSVSYFAFSFFDNRIKVKNRMELAKINSIRESKLYKAKLDFFTQVAHDIKTPLTLIKAPLEKLLKQKDFGDEKSSRLLNTMQKNTEKLVQLTNSILDFRKIEIGGNTLHFKWINVSSVVDNFLMVFLPSFDLRNIELSNQSEADIYGYMDVEIITKILENLFSNALKYGQSKVIVQSFVDLKLNQWIFKIKNDGNLLSNAESELMFKPFHRSANHVHIEGSGLGLALAHSFAQLHKGDLHYAENTENLNIFVLAIPLT